MVFELPAGTMAGISRILEAAPRRGELGWHNATELVLDAVRRVGARTLALPLQNVE